MGGHTTSGSKRHARSARAAPAGAQRGFTYLGILMAVALLGIAMAATGVVWSTQSRREREAQLLWVGNQYREAIGRYRMAGGTLPRELAQLVQDERTPKARRFLRQLYPDPMTGEVDWQLITAADGGILGVASSSQAQPIKVANFPAEYAAFEDATCYCDWKFVWTARKRGGVQGAKGAQGQNPTPSPAQNPLHPTR